MNPPGKYIISKGKLIKCKGCALMLAVNALISATVKPPLFNLLCIYVFIYLYFTAFDKGRMLPNTDLSRDFMGLVVDGLMDLGTHIWHSPQIFCRGG